MAPKDNQHQDSPPELPAVDQRSRKPPTRYCLGKRFALSGMLQMHANLGRVHPCQQKHNKRAGHDGNQIGQEKQTGSTHDALFTPLPNPKPMVHSGGINATAIATPGKVVTASPPPKRHTATEPANPENRATPRSSKVGLVLANISPVTE